MNLISEEYQIGTLPFYLWDINFSGQEAAVLLLYVFDGQMAGPLKLR